MRLGQHIKEFTDFLTKHTDTFQVIDECVILVGCENLQDVPLSERLHLPQPTIDTKATQQLLDYFAQCIETKGKLSHVVSDKTIKTISCCVGERECVCGECSRNDGGWVPKLGGGYSEKKTRLAGSQTWYRCTTENANEMIEKKWYDTVAKKKIARKFEERWLGRIKKCVPKNTINKFCEKGQANESFTGSFEWIKFETFR